MENDLVENLVSWIEDRINEVIKQVVVESNDKRYSRIKVLKTVVEIIEKELKR